MSSVERDVEAANCGGFASAATALLSFDFSTSMLVIQYGVVSFTLMKVMLLVSYR